MCTERSDIYDKATKLQKESAILQSSQGGNQEMAAVILMATFFNYVS